MSSFSYVHDSKHHQVGMKATDTALLGHLQEEGTTYLRCQDDEEHTDVDNHDHDDDDDDDYDDDDDDNNDEDDDDDNDNDGDDDGLLPHQGQACQAHH